MSKKYMYLSDDEKKSLHGIAKDIVEKNDGLTSGSHLKDALRDAMPELCDDSGKFYEAVWYLEDMGIEFDPEDVEDVDDEFGDAENADLAMQVPYDASKIDIVPQTLSLDAIISLIRGDKIDLMPDFQRKPGLWTDAKKSRLIESMILRIPLPVFYFDGSDYNRWVVIDGLQRLTAFKEFFVDKTLRLTGMEFLKKLDGCTCDQIPPVYMRRMTETRILAYVMRPGAPDSLKYNIFKRINTGGMELEPQEIRHAIYHGYSTEYLEELADTDLFRRATGYSVRTERMLDREFALRFIAFYELGVEKYGGVIDTYLNEAMAVLNGRYDSDRPYAQSVKERFFAALEASLDIFGKFAFRRMPDEDRRRAVSKALFEAWTALLAKRSDEELGRLVENRESVKRDYVGMFSSDDEFTACIRSGKVSSVRRMFERIDALIERYSRC